MKEYSIDVNLTEEDLYDLQRDRSFKWNWNTKEDEKVVIKIHLFKGEEDDDEDMFEERDRAMERYTSKLKNKLKELK